MRPFLKWPGGKYRILDAILAVLPAGERLVEPFAGGAAVFLNADFRSYHLNDANLDLITLYQLLQHHGQAFIDDCKPYFSPRYNRADSYYRLRAKFNASRDPYLRSVLFLYMNRHGYNGLCRYNSSAGYNVPFGSYAKPYFPELEMQYFFQKSQYADITHLDFTKIMQQAKKGHILYCDPPYVPLSKTANFTAYQPGRFGLEQQKLLAQLAQQAAKRGAPVLLSNHNTPFTRRAYATAQIQLIDAPRLINCQAKKRGKVSEVLALFAGIDKA